MSGESVGKLGRIGKCPKCQEIFPESTGYKVFKCGGCGAHLEGEKSSFCSPLYLSSCKTVQKKSCKHGEVSLASGDKVSYRSELWRLIRIRDLISLLLSYPVKLAEEDKDVLKSWTNAFPEWKALLLSNNDHGVTKEDSPLRVLTDKALGCMKGLIPIETITKFERYETGRSFFFDDNYLIPTDIDSLSIDLAVEQLIQTLFAGDDYARNIRYVKLSTNDNLKKRFVVEKIGATLVAKNNLFGVDKDFYKAFLIDASIYETDVDVRVQEEINRVMVGVKKTMASDNRYLVILVGGDNAEKLDPQNVSFPAGTVVLITTETFVPTEEGDELTCSVDLNINTQDHLLPWKVFCRYAGIGMVSSITPILEIAARIVKECCGHLLAIVLVAKSLNHVEDVKQWDLALEKLCYTNHSFDYQEIDQLDISKAMVNVFVNIVWEGINERQKLCLELCLFIHNIRVGVPWEILMSIWVDSIDIELEYTREDAEDDIIELLDRFVLLPCETGNVRLPIESYDIIESLHTLNPSIIRHGALGLTDPPYIGRWHGLIRIELMDNQMFELPESPDCPKLQVLLLQGNVDLMDIPETFFDYMPMLRHLDLSYTSIRYLPSSISKLRMLKKFYLRRCDLFMELPQNIGQLKNLEELDLEGTLITHLPGEIRELVNMQRLTLCFDVYFHERGQEDKIKQISHSTIIPPRVISSFTKLNYLSINVDPEDERWNENVAGILLEIFGLERLETVSLYVPKVELLNVMPAQKPLDLRLVVGHHTSRLISRAPPDAEEKFKHLSCSLKFVNGVDVPNGVTTNLERFRALYLDRHMTIKTLSEFPLKKLDKLEVCILGECNEMETIVDGSYPVTLQNLELLRVYYMKNLRSICEGNRAIGKLSLRSLKCIAFHTCPILTTIFTLSFVGNLNLLEELIVEDCPKVTTLISHHSSEHYHGTHFFLPRLKKISLLYLPELVNIFNGLHAGQCLQEMGFYYCPKLRILSKEEFSSKQLRVIKGERSWWEALKWNEGGWEDAGRPDFLNLIFSPINQELDIMTQLTVYDYQHQANTMTEPAPHDNKVQWRDWVRVERDQGLEGIPDDGYTWIKYGQKDIHGAKYPRSYYRCACGSTRGCRAKKRIQKSDEDPTLFEITYRERHTCSSNYGQADIITELAAHKKLDQVIAGVGGDHQIIESNPMQSQGSKQRNENSKLPSDPEEVEDLRIDIATKTKPLIVFTYKELTKITRNFGSDCLLGEGGFGKVYKGFISEELSQGLPPFVAVKVHDVHNSYQGQKEWLAEVTFLGQLSHPNLVKLIGYCCEDEHRVLIYEYVVRGSVDRHLFSRYQAPLSWSIRMKIALGAAKGLAFLHEVEKPVIYRDFNMSNILVDREYNAKLSDFGLAKDGPVGSESHVTTRVMRTYGYAAPEYIMTGHLTPKSDVYGFGVVLLELLTGRRSIDKSRPAQEQSLVQWARPLLKEKKKFLKIIDPRLEGHSPGNVLHKAAKLAYQCLKSDPKARPQMRDIVVSLEPLYAYNEIFRMEVKV